MTTCIPVFRRPFEHSGQPLTDIIQNWRSIRIWDEWISAFELKAGVNEQ